MTYGKFCASAMTFAALSMSSPVLAQTQADQLKVAYAAARNQLGVLHYCVDKGHIDASAVDAQKKLIGVIPAPADASGGDAAEAAGRKGTVSAMGIEQDIEASATAQKTTAAALCTQIAGTVKQIAEKLPK